MTGVEPRAGTTQTISLFQCPIGGTDGIDDTDVTDEYTHEADEPNDDPAKDGRAKPIYVQDPHQDQNNRDREEDPRTTAEMTGGMPRNVITTLEQSLLNDET